MAEIFKTKKKYLFLLIPLFVFIFVFVRKGANSKSMTTKVIRGEIIEAVYGIGTVTANKSFYLKVAIPTALRDLRVKEGDDVKKGQALVRFEETTFHAPFAGTVTSIQYKVGEIVAPQTTILSIVNMKDRYLTVSLEQLGAIKIKRGQKAMLHFEGLPGKSFLSFVESIFANQNQFFVRVGADSLPQEILPGMTVDVAIEVNKKSQVLLAPVAALKNGEITYIHGHSKKTEKVKTGLVDGDKFEVLDSNLQEGDDIILQTEVK